MPDPLTEQPASGRSERALHLAEGAIVVGTALGFALSYSALQRLAAAHGYSAWEAALWPLSVDFVAVATTALAMTLARCKRGPIGETWALAAAAALVSLLGNVLSVYHVTGAWGDAVAALMHAWAAAVYIGLWHALFRTVQAGRRASAETPERGERAGSASMALAPLTTRSFLSPSAGDPGAARPEPTALERPVDTTPAWPPVAPASAEQARAERHAERRAPRRRRSVTSDPRVRVRALVKAADERGERLTGVDVARAIGRSPQRGRALLAEVRAELADVAVETSPTVASDDPDDGHVLPAWPDTMDTPEAMAVAPAMAGLPSGHGRTPGGTMSAHEARVAVTRLAEAQQVTGRSERHARHLVGAAFATADLPVVGGHDQQTASRGEAPE